VVFVFIPLVNTKRMGRGMEPLAMEPHELALANVIDSDMKELKIAVMRLIEDGTRHGDMGFGAHFLRWLASLAAM